MSLLSNLEILNMIGQKHINISEATYKSIIKQLLKAGKHTKATCMLYASPMQMVWILTSRMR